MPPTVTATGTRVERGLTLAIGGAVVIALGGVVRAMTQEHPVEAAGATVLLLAVGLAWWQRLRGRRHAVLVLAAAVLALSLLPVAGFLALLLILLVPLTTALDEGFRLAAAVSVVFATVFAVDALARFDDATARQVLVENGLLLVLLLFAAGLGSLILATEQARAEVVAANAELRRSLVLERELVLAEERARSAGELHDGLGHRLTLVSMALDYAQRVRERDPQLAWSEVSTAAETTQQALADMRLWVRALAPPAAPEGVGGAAAFEAIAAAFRGTGLDVRVTHHGDETSLGRDVSLFATRFVQEGLTNVLRHARAGRVDIDVRQSPQQLRLSIADDGSGADLDPGEGFGRRSLRERAELLDGRLDVGRSALGGFELSAVLPLGGGA